MRPGSSAAAFGFVLIAAWATLYETTRASGLRGQYFLDPAFSGTPSVSELHRTVSSADVYGIWHAAPPPAFSVQWSGYLNLASAGADAFHVDSDGTAAVFVDGKPVVTDRAMTLAAGSHPLQVRYSHTAGKPLIRLSWSHDGSALETIPGWMLSASPRPGWMVTALQWLRRVCRVLAIACALGVAVIVAGAAIARRPVGSPFWLAARIALFLAVGGFYYAAATAHASTVNTFKARGDQSAYLTDAEEVYANWSGRIPQRLIGGRARMPIYTTFLALAYDPDISDVEFFDIAKRWNIELSLVLIALFTVIVSWELPPLLSTNLALIVGLGCFVFKAGYSQPELPFYFLFFVAFLGCWHLFLERDGKRSVALGVLAGVFAGLADLTKGLLPPFVVIFLAAYGVEELIRLRRFAADGYFRRTFPWRAAAGAAMLLSFLAVVFPYINESHRISGEYFYNLNTTFYMWYDEGNQGRLAVYPRTDVEGRLLAPREQFQNRRTYLASHTFGQIESRIGYGLEDLAVRSYAGYTYWKYVLLYLGFTVFLVATNTRTFLDLLRAHTGLAVFLVAYAIVYLAGSAFFVPTSSTGGIRFLLAHLAPLMFALSCFFALAPFRNATTLFGAGILILMSFELSFTLWRRVMTTYGGF
jgi:hypothetical protein